LGASLIAICGATLLGAMPAQAADLTASTNADPSFFTGLFGESRANLLGDMGGLRTALGNYGITFNLTETSEELGNVTGGTQRGFDYEGLTTATVQVDTSKAFGPEGGTFNVSALQIHGRNLSADNLSSLQTASGIEAEGTTRLWELWYQQSFLDGDFDVKFGQQSIDQEFMASQGSALYVNTMMGWPMVPSADLYAGGPAYPLSSLGFRARGNIARNVTVLAGMFDDNPPGGSFSNDDQLLGAEAGGTRFNLGTGALIISEIQYGVNQPALGDMATPDQKDGLPGMYKLGFWYDTAKYPDQRFDASGVSLATSATGIPAMHQGNYSFYAVADQTIWQPDPQDPQSVAVFIRPMWAPDDRNAIDFSVNAGVNLKAPLPGRDDDTFGVGYGLAHVSSRLAALDGDLTAAGSPTIKQTQEQFIEVTYQAQVAQWWQVQPDVQYVFNPGAGEYNPNNVAEKVKDELVLGVRTNITF
jgi:porin